MLEQTAIVMEVTPGYVMVESQRKSTCQGCGIKKACGTSLLDNLFATSRVRMKVRDEIGVKPGDEVMIAIDENSLVKVSALMYLLPLLMLFLFAGLAGELLDMRETYVFLAGLTGMLAGFYVIKRLAPVILAFSETEPVVTKVLNHRDILIQAVVRCD